MQFPTRFWGKALLIWLFLHLTNGDDLDILQEAFFRWHVNEAPEFATAVSNEAFNDRLDDYSLGILETHYTSVRNFLNDALSIARSDLSSQQQYSYDVFVDTLRAVHDNYEWRNYGALNPVNFAEGFYLNLDKLIRTTPFNTKTDFENFISRLESRPTQINQMITRMRKSIELGTTYHNVSVRPVPSQISAVINEAPENSKLYLPFKTELVELNLPVAEKEDLKVRGKRAIETLWRYLGSLKDFMETTYFQHTRQSFGVGNMTSGHSYYSACLNWHLTVNMDVSEVHQTGLREVERIKGLMTQVIRRQGFNGNVAEYFNELQNDPQFHRNSSEAILQTFNDLIFHRISPKIRNLFKDTPQRDLLVKPLPFDGPMGMYLGGTDENMPGTFYVNVHRPEEMGTYDMVYLALHEAIPGHHLQGSYQMAATLPNFQKFIEYAKMYQVPYHFPFFSTYAEGWGLYAEYLGEEMRVYSNDYELMGRYAGEILRACRLVVDTGIHAYGWSRNRAIDYLKEHAALSQAKAEGEVDRYATWPGQACSYKIGELKIKELRERASTELGPRFNIKDFHSRLLTNGPVPLSVMQTIVEDYIADPTGNTEG